MSQVEFISIERLEIQDFRPHPSAWHCVCVCGRAHAPLLLRSVCDAFVCWFQGYYCVIVLTQLQAGCVCVGGGVGKWNPPSVLYTQTIVWHTHSCHDLKPSVYTLLGKIYQSVLLHRLKWTQYSIKTIGRLWFNTKTYRLLITGNNKCFIVIPDI